jgi:hypothetical protein
VASDLWPASATPQASGLVGFAAKIFDDVERFALPFGIRVLR